MEKVKIGELSFAYEGTEKLILNHIDLEIRQGEFVCILGQSGCGKSTLLRLLAGLEKPEVSEIHWVRANSGNVFVTIAKQKGYFDEVGLNIIEDPVDSQADALTALGNGKVDVTSNQGTNNPLSYISQGQDFTIVGGYMLKGMYIVAKKGNGWNGVTDLVGKKFAGPASQLQFGWGEKKTPAYSIEEYVTNAKKRLRKGMMRSRLISLHLIRMDTESQNE